MNPFDLERELASLRPVRPSAALGGLKGLPSFHAKSSPHSPNGKPVSAPLCKWAAGPRVAQASYTASGPSASRVVKCRGS